MQIVAFSEKECSPCEIGCTFYLAVVKPSSIEEDPHDESIETETPKMYLKLQSLIEFDSFVITHGPFTSVDCGEILLVFASLTIITKQQQFALENPWSQVTYFLFLL